MMHVLGVLPEERRKAALLLLHYVWVVAVTIAGKSVRDTYFLTRYDKSYLPLMAVAAAIAVAVSVALFTRAERHLRSKILMPLACVVFAGSLALLHFRLEGWTVPVLYVWMEVINVITVLQFWLLAAELLDPRQAKRLFPLIGGGGSLAAILIGPQLKPFAKAYGSDTLLWLVCALLLGSALVAMATTRLPKVPVIHSHAKSARRSRRRLASPYIRMISVIVVCAAVVSAIVDYQFKIISSGTLRTEADLVGFFGQFYAATGVSTLVLQFLVAGRAFQRFGVVVAMAILPFALGLGSMSILFWPVLGSAVMARFSDQTFRFTLHNGGLELLWLPVSPDLREEAKPFVGGSLKSMTEGAVGLMMFALLTFLPPPQLSVVSLVFCSAWAGSLLMLRKLYVLELQSAIANRRLPPEDLEVSATDALTVKVIDRSLLEGDTAQRLFVLDLISNIPFTPWRNSLRQLLEQGEPEVKARILQIASGDETIVTPEILRELAEKNGTEAIEAIRTIGTAGVDILRTTVAGRLHDREPAIRAAACGSLIRLSGNGGSAAREQLNTMLSSHEPRERVAALEESARIDGAITVESLARALSDPAREVRAEALEIAARQPDVKHAGLIASCVADPALFSDVRKALAALPASTALSVLVSQLDSKPPIATRRATLRAMKTCLLSDAQPVLLNEVDGCWPALADQASESLLVVARNVPPSADALDLADRRRSNLVNEVLVLNEVLCTLPDTEDTQLLRDYLETSTSSLLPSVIRLAALRQPDAPIETCIQILHSQDRARLPFVLELFDTLLTPSEREKISPLLEVSCNRSRSSGAGPRSSDAALLSNWLANSLCADNEWLRAISLDYILNSFPASPVDRIEWERVPASPLIREVAASSIRRRPSAAAKIPQTITADIEKESGGMLTILERTILLKSVPLFSDIAAEELSRVAQIAEQHLFPAQAVICRDGDHADCLYVIVSGSVRIQKRGLELAVLTRAHSLGEMAVIDSSPRSADVIAIEDTVVLRVGQEQFLEAMQSNMHILQGVVRMLLARLRRADEQLAEKLHAATGARSG